MHMLIFNKNEDNNKIYQILLLFSMYQIYRN